ncbi:MULTISPECIES: carbamate kinase [Aerococcus]|uniref:carbamate kinase n=1 Tax=Aerococcus urinae (strain CCUG 59500 / ACS-120-V-Col10a) TaxID=2976812 RepID=UPI000200E7D2|nr:carbamate kinase [Aerococcus sp. Group 1]AEA01420.1 carbamate kinase [Aerococcus sp. Group 1]MCY3030007.1 carbamate kinase [Aerococcus sp. Group 1]MCY3054786.1 carbamate kinase [Aerococcus sp. Group 1]MCY3056516.1 carbamate kinase [Aerococcus sp. Group 1]MCY3061195.1 carbamate kinase [Aerococcus sp. Group 1]
MSKIVLALGGNALGSTPNEQKEAVKTTAQSIVDLIEAGNEIIVSHGNGPQVGMINLAMDVSAKSDAGTPEMPFPECGAMSQGYIGFHLQNAIENELNKRGVDKAVASVITQVVVDKDDPAFDNPTKPIGAFYSEEEAQALSDKGFAVKEDAGRGYRRVVASPKPIDIVEKDFIQDAFDQGNIIVAAGGGGIPVVEAEDGYDGVPAVIDKDFSSAKLAELVEADLLIILTAVEKVAIHFGKENEEWLDELTVDQAKEYTEAGEFAEGSMKPKIEAALGFVESKPGNQAIITSLEKAEEGIKGQNGTLIK